MLEDNPTDFRQYFKIHIRLILNNRIIWVKAAFLLWLLPRVLPFYQDFSKWIILQPQKNYKPQHSPWLHCSCRTCWPSDFRNHVWPFLSLYFEEKIYWTNTLLPKTSSFTSRREEEFTYLPSLFTGTGSWGYEEEEANRASKIAASGQS